MAPRETENNTYAKFWGDKQRALWYVMVFSGVVNTEPGRPKGLSTYNFINSKYLSVPDWIKFPA